MNGKKTVDVQNGSEVSKALFFQELPQDGSEELAILIKALCGDKELLRPVQKGTVPDKMGAKSAMLLALEEVPPGGFGVGGIYGIQIWVTDVLDKSMPKGLRAILSQPALFRMETVPEKNPIWVVVISPVIEKEIRATEAILNEPGEEGPAVVYGSRPKKTDENIAAEYFAKSLSGKEVTVSPDKIKVKFLEELMGEKIFTAQYEMKADYTVKGKIYFRRDKSVSTLITAVFNGDETTYRCKWDHYKGLEEEKEDRNTLGLTATTYLVSGYCSVCRWHNHENGRYYGTDEELSSPITMTKKQTEEAFDDAFDDLQKKHNQGGECKERIAVW